MRNCAVVIVCLLLGAVACSRDPATLRQKYVESGDKYFKQSKFAEAAVQYANAVRQDPESGMARMRLADAHMAAGHTRAAFPEYIRAADLLPNDLDAQMKAGGLLLNGGLFEEAKNRARAILQKDPKNPAGLMLLGNSLAGLKNVDDALDVVNRAIEIDPERAGVYSNVGVLQLAKGDHALAETAFKRAVAVSPQSVDAYVNLGNFYRAVKRYPEAEEALKRALPFGAKNPRLNRAIASLYVEWNKLPEAEPYLKTVVDLDQSEGARFGLADYYVACGRLDEAIAILSELSAEKGRFVSAKTRIAMLLFAAGKRPEADKVADEVLAREPRSAAALTVKARLLLAENRTSDALARIKTAIEVDPRSASAQLTLARIQLASNHVEDARKALMQVLQLDPRSLAAQMELSELHRNRGEVDSAILFAEQAAASRPDNTKARLELVRALLVRDTDAPRAEKEIRTLLARHPNSSDAVSALAALYLSRNDQVAAKRVFERALELDPTSLEALSGLVAIDLGNKQIRAASARIDAALAKRGESAPVLLLAAKVYALVGDPKKMEDLLKRALAADPGNPETYSALGQLYAQQGRLDDARRQFTDVVKLEPQSVAGPTMLGLISYAQRDLPEAERWWTRALEIDPRTAAAANNLAWVIAERDGNLDQALQLAQSAKAKYPSQPDINDTVGWIYYKKHATTQALSFLLQSTDKDPHNATYQFHLGMTYAQAGDDAKARRALERALAIQKDFDGATLARQTLAKLVY
jgi:tetratricopeptide (TPR) repeat protein